MRGFGGQLPGALYLGNDFKISCNEREICNFKLLGVIMSIWQAEIFPFSLFINTKLKN